MIATKLQKISSDANACTVLISGNVQDCMKHFHSYGSLDHHQTSSACKYKSHQYYVQ